MADANHVECGFCKRSNEDLEKPKILACTHIHCAECLIGYWEINHVIKCPIPGCGLVVEKWSPDQLPSHDVDKDSSSKWCDVCISKGLGKEPAVIHCIDCGKECNFCSQHEKKHDEIFEQHQKIKIDELRSQAVKKEMRYCLAHPELPYTLGCEVCLSIFCEKCVGVLRLCTSGSGHTHISLDELSSALVKDELISQMIAKEEVLEMLFKRTSNTIAEHNNNTTEMVQLLRNTRKEQLTVIAEKYDKMEDELIQIRQKSQTQITEFMEGEVLARWTQVRNQRYMLERALTPKQQADAVNNFKAAKSEISREPAVNVPKLILERLTELEYDGECRSTEVEMVSSYGLVIDSEHGFNASQFLPSSLKWLATVTLPAKPISVCYYEGNTYVGLSNYTVVKIDKDHQLHESFISCNHHHESLAIYKERIYALLYNEDLIKVYDMLGREVMQWKVSCWDYQYRNVMCIVSNQLVLAETLSNRAGITMYSLTGQMLRFIPRTAKNALGSGIECICAAGKDHVVISNHYTSQVSKLSISTGEKWVCSKVNKPMGVHSCGRGYIVVACDRSTTLKILETQTGKVVKEIPADFLTEGQKPDITIFMNHLAVADYDSKQIHFYELVA